MVLCSSAAVLLASLDPRRTRPMAEMREEEKKGAGGQLERKRCGAEKAASRPTALARRRDPEALAKKQNATSPGTSSARAPAAATSASRTPRSAAPAGGGRTAAAASRHSGTRACHRGRRRSRRRRQRPRNLVAEASLGQEARRGTAAPTPSAASGTTLCSNHEAKNSWRLW